MKSEDGRVTLIKLHTVNCDASWSQSVVQSVKCLGWIGNEDTALAARKMASRAGWKRIDGQDYCPECVKSITS